MRDPKFTISNHSDPTPDELLNSQDKAWIYKNSPLRNSDLEELKMGLKSHSTIIYKGSYKLLFYNDNTFSSNLLHGKIFYPGDGMTASSTNVIDCTHVHVKAENGKFDETNRCTMDNYEAMGKQEPHIFAPLEPNSALICVINEDPYTSGSAHVVDWTYLKQNESFSLQAKPEYYYTVGKGKISVNGIEKMPKDWIRVAESKILNITAIEPTLFYTFEEEVFN